MEPDTETLDICLPFAVYTLYGTGDFRPEWRTEAVVGLATGILEDAAFNRMPILADALEEAGCTDYTLLNHCRDPIPHDHQCWALGLALNRYVPPEPTPTPVVVEPPRLVAPAPRPGASSTGDKGGWFVGTYGVFFILWIAFKVLQSGTESTPPPPYQTPYYSPRPFQPVVVPAPATPNPWTREHPSDWTGIYDARQRELANPAKFKAAYPWMKARPPGGEVPGGTR